MREMIGAYVVARKSNVGAKGTCVPPSTSTRLGPLAVSSAGNRVCKRSVALPALPIENA